MSARRAAFADRTSGGSDRDGGSAVVEFVMISALLVFLMFGVLQVVAVLYVRSIVAASAADGAHYAASAGLGGAVGGARANQVMATALASSLTSGIACRGDDVIDPASGLRVARVVCTGRIRSIFVPVGLFIAIHVRSRSLEETP